MKEIQDLWDKGFKEITLWDKTLTVTLVRRWFEKDFVAATEMQKGNCCRSLLK
jgi:tRNA-2-methylthio-N6-dimethylallyladenosine synthase